MERRSELVPGGSQRDTSEQMWRRQRRCLQLRESHQQNLARISFYCYYYFPATQSHMEVWHLGKVLDWPAACWDWCVTESKALRGRSAGGCRCAFWSWGRWCIGCRNLYRAHWPSPIPIGGSGAPEWLWPSWKKGRGNRNRRPQVTVHLLSPVCWLLPSAHWTCRSSPPPSENYYNIFLEMFSGLK